VKYPALTLHYNWMSYVVAAAVVDDNFRCLEMSAAQLNRAPGFMQAVMNNDKLLDSSE